jgi:hypothetical protein
MSVRHGVVNTLVNNKHTKHMKTPILEELLITLEGATTLFDMESDDEHPDPIDDAIELVREAAGLLAEYLNNTL